MIMSVMFWLAEVAIAIFIVWGILNEKKLIRIERAAAKAGIWELYERFAEKDVRRVLEDGENDG